ncbi:TetR/AcrR family transcriptional regulator [Enterobacter sp. DTU_2021_1002640_1_SI_PRY_ASU_LCPMC_013]|uniref:TetR/AcrR family transcriptional regulator n=1 Tax=Enterobacter sp. DTU_2021_1002640_1_SI_PRY_ASU_LCPMC_013 TaxID=3077940 RepID=UPI001A146B62|nr:TetR/AcrR family transcriptional regulator [Enterobacter sp. DTU_2021_1002640_1_SI_PRY_ASU_LCPMC_013]EGQ5292038.1 TetR/AcrR family transcriptional regulator [Enterobacter hormaechei]EGQ5292808.1 TetR/AcrR family transcriptional regulator [Enterobacter hormaechei]WNV02425.1 TetR/AcrR family transcriptional regulator [Enterobacter sp. DTU_2021_1002640_1_SI_PRY_ASU_LCPMC_013]
MKTSIANKNEKISVREKIVLTAHELFYSTGFKATGVDTIIRQAHVTKVTFYRHFPSKNLLILAYLHYRHEIWIDWFETALRLNVDEGRTASDALAATLHAWFVMPSFHGCAFINASAEAKSEEVENEIKEICRIHKLETKEKIAALTAISDEQRLNEIMILIDGAIIHAQMGMDVDAVIHGLKSGLEKITGQAA